MNWALMGRCFKLCAREVHSLRQRLPLGGGTPWKFARQVFFRVMVVESRGFSGLPSYGLLELASFMGGGEAQKRGSLLPANNVVNGLIVGGSAT